MTGQLPRDDVDYIGEVSCALPDLKYIFLLCGAVVIAGALVIWTINRLRLW